MTSQPALVLVVDDAEDTRVVYAEFLRFRGYRVEEACDGKEALEKILELNPDLVILDVSLPYIDGCEATRRLKADPRTQGIPILVLTGRVHPGARDSALAAGADAFVSKPCLPDDLMVRIEKLLKK